MGGEASSVTYYFAYCDEFDPFSEAMHVEDEAIFELAIEQNEGDLATLAVEVANPYIGLLGPGRKQWCWVSWFDGTSIVAMFHGRLVGVPARLTQEVVTLFFLGRPSDYLARKDALAAELSELPYVDPVWLDKPDADKVLEARSALYHTDRVTHELTISDIIDGEDGLIDVSENEHFYDGVSVDPGAAPLRRVIVNATVTWTQSGVGDVDLTAPLVTAFQDAGSPFAWPLVSSYTGDGLLSDWPEPNASMSGGWAMAPGSSAAIATEVGSTAFAVRYIDKSDNTSVEGFDRPATVGTNALGGSVINYRGAPRDFFINWKNFNVVFECMPIRANLTLTFTAERKRSEIVRFPLGAAVQSILTDPVGAEEEIVEMNSTFVDQPVDPDGALPIGDLRRTAYFPTDRGQMSLQFLVLLARYKLRMRARAVTVKFQGTWAKFAQTVSCRKNALLHDRRLPGGQAIGKIIAYRLVASGTGDNFAELSIGCSIGYGIVLPEAAAGDDTYATGYSRGYTARTGGEVAIIAGELHYDDLAGTYAVDDDGIDLFNMLPETVIKSLTVTDGPNDQDSAIRLAIEHPGEVPEVNLRTTADIVGTAVTNLASVEGLVEGAQYIAVGKQIVGIAYSNPMSFPLPGFPNGITRGPTFFTFDGASGGTLSQDLAEGVAEKAFAASSGRDRTKGRQIAITNDDRRASRGITPDPIGALGKHPTIVDLELVAVTGGEFQTEYAVTVMDLVIPKHIDLEAV